MNKDNEQLKESKFQETLQKLETKKKLRQRKQLIRARNRANFQKEHPIVVNSLRIFTLFVITVSLYYIYDTSYELYENYTNTRKWEKVSKIPISTIDVETLYASEEDKALREKYLSIRSSLWDDNQHTFTSNISEEKIDELKSTFDSISSSKEKLQETHDEILVMWDVKKSLDSMFEDGSISHETIKLNYNLMMISDILNESFNKISPYLINEKYQLAHQYYVEISNISDDVLKMNEIMNMFNSSYQIEKIGKKLSFKTSMTYSESNDLNKRLNNLMYSWQISTHVLRNILTKSDSIFSLNEADSTAYSSYLLDEENKEKFSEYLKKYKSDIEKLKSEVVDVINYSGLKRSEVETDLSNKGIYTEWISEPTTDSTKDGLIINQSVDHQIYKKIRKGSTIRFTYYEYEEYRPSSSSSTFRSSSTSRSSSSSNSSNSSSSSTLTESSSTTSSSRRTIE